MKGFFGFGLGFNRGHVPGYGPTTSRNAGRCSRVASRAIRQRRRGRLRPNGQAWSAQRRVALPLAGGSARTRPAQNVDKSIKESDSVYRVNLSWKATDTSLLYATWSEGYRPGGINRNPVRRRLRLRTSSPTMSSAGSRAGRTTGCNSTAPCSSRSGTTSRCPSRARTASRRSTMARKPRSQGTEMQLDWLATDNLRLSLAGAYYDTRADDDYCDLDAAGDCSKRQAPAGTPLPITAGVQGQRDRALHVPAGRLRCARAGIARLRRQPLPPTSTSTTTPSCGDIPSSTFLDLAFGIENDKYAIELFVANATDEDAPLFVDAECAPGVCGVQAYGVSAAAADVRHPVLAGLLSQDAS